MWFSKSDYLWNHCCGQTQNEAEGFLCNKPSWTTPPTSSLYCCFTRYPETWPQPRSDYWAVQMDDPTEDHNQKEKRGKRTQNWERHSRFTVRLLFFICLNSNPVSHSALLSCVAKKINGKNKLSLPQSQKLDAINSVESFGCASV